VTVCKQLIFQDKRVRKTKQKYMCVDKKKKNTNKQFIKEPQFLFWGGAIVVWRLGSFSLFWGWVGG